MRRRIHIANLHHSYRIDERAIGNIARRVMSLIKREGAAELEIIFLDDNGIRKLNRRYKHRDRPTDVLSFRIDRGEFGRKDFLGVIAISADTARRNAEAFGTGFPEEVVLYVIHGILHLFGYDDRTPGKRARMSNKQEEILRKICSCKNLSRVLMPR
ncbi:MAG: rRNA maturation RNase YbeY [Candidatus Omnitrophica bacterium]|nr:rRNA maturation RNase YbeY [Candidatus Omnitrophota bacterium]